MTTQEKLHAVETAIRKELPRLLEPTVGCYVEEINQKNEQLLQITGDAFSYQILDYFSQEITEIEEEEFSKNYKIIGHDILLTDVLEWLDNIDLTRYSIHNGFLIDLDDIGFELEVDLSKPYLKDQSEELIDFLFKLIDEE